MSEIETWAGVAETAKLVARMATFMAEDAGRQDVQAITHDLPALIVASTAIARFVYCQGGEDMIVVQQQAIEPNCHGCRHLITVSLGNSRLYRCALFDGPSGWRGLDRSGHVINVPQPETEDCWEPAKGERAQ